MADEPELVRVTNVSTVPHTYEHRQDVSPTRAHYVWPPGESRAVPVAVADVICQAHPAKLQRLGGGELENLLRAADLVAGLAHAHPGLEPDQVGELVGAPGEQFAGAHEDFITLTPGRRLRLAKRLVLTFPRPFPVPFSVPTATRRWTGQGSPR